MIADPRYLCCIAESLSFEGHSDSASYLFHLDLRAMSVQFI